MSVFGQPPAFFIGQADSARHVRAQDAVLFDEIRDGLLSLVGPPGNRGHQHESKPNDIHDRGSLHHTQ